MVYCGKLSKACLPCRKRKLLCDLRRDRCSQCMRAQLTCSGYRDTNAIRFRDESTAVQVKIQRRKLAKPARIPQTISLSLCCQAKDVFFHNYVLGTDSNGAHKPYDFLRTFYSPDPEDEHLIRIVDAVSLSYFNYQRPSPSAVVESREHYISALRMTGSALKDSKLASKDSTLIAVLMLDLYEKINSKDPSYGGAWAAHVDGAMALITLRGDAQYENLNSLRILIRLSTNMLISNVAQVRQVPAELVALRARIAGHYAEPHDAKWRLTDLSVQHADLMYRIQNSLITKHEALSSALELDAIYLSFSRSVGPFWKYHSIQVDKKVEHPHVYQESYHIYRDEYVAQMWNVLRFTRIGLNEYICSQCTAGLSAQGISSTVSSLHEQARENIMAMMFDICASVPQFLGDAPAPTEPEPKPSKLDCSSASVGGHSRGLHIGKSRATQYLPCYRLIFPLYVVAQSTKAPPSLKQWIIEQLEFMSDHHVLENAAAVASILKSGRRVNAWHVYAMLGSYAFVC